MLEFTLKVCDAEYPPVTSYAVPPSFRQGGLCSCYISFARQIKMYCTKQKLKTRNPASYCLQNTGFRFIYPFLQGRLC